MLYLFVVVVLLIIPTPALAQVPLSIRSGEAPLSVRAAVDEAMTGNLTLVALRRQFETARLRPALVRDLEAVRANLATRAEQVVDARSRGRFAGTESEPRAGLRGGHIPGSLNLPYDELYRPDGTLRPESELRDAFAKAGLDPARPVITSCGSGVTASVLALALHLLGRRDVAVYDGSWSEWGADPDTPVERS